jgi:hypothetical protein
LQLDGETAPIYCNGWRVCGVKKVSILAEFLGTPLILRCSWVSGTPCKSDLSERCSTESISLWPYSASESQRTKAWLKCHISTETCGQMCLPTFKIKTARWSKHSILCIQRVKKCVDARSWLYLSKIPERWCWTMNTPTIGTIARHAYWCIVWRCGADDWTQHAKKRGQALLIVVPINKLSSDSVWLKYAHTFSITD